MMLNEWISVKDRLPKHGQPVLAVNKTGSQCIVLFIDNKQMYDLLRNKGVKVHKDLPDPNGYCFASQEVHGNFLNNVTHWMPLPEPPSDE